jgi:hypothetical protein
MRPEKDVCKASRSNLVLAIFQWELLQPHAHFELSVTRAGRNRCSRQHRPGPAPLANTVCSCSFLPRCLSLGCACLGRRRDVTRRNGLQMLKGMFVLLVLSSTGLAQSSSDGSFSVRHLKNASYSLKPAQMREAERIYRSACAVVQHDFHNGSSELHPRFTVIIGAERDEVHTTHSPADEILMTKWDPLVFAQGAVVLAFDQMLPLDVSAQLAKRAFRQSNATVDVAGFK